MLQITSALQEAKKIKKHISEKELRKKILGSLNENSFYALFKKLYMKNDIVNAKLLREVIKNSSIFNTGEMLVDVKEEKAKEKNNTANIKNHFVILDKKFFNFVKDTGVMTEKDIFAVLINNKIVNKNIFDYDSRDKVQEYILPTNDEIRNLELFRCWQTIGYEIPESFLLKLFSDIKSNVKIKEDIIENAITSYYQPSSNETLYNLFVNIAIRDNSDRFIKLFVPLLNHEKFTSVIHKNIITPVLFEKMKNVLINNNVSPEQIRETFDPYLYVKTSEDIQRFIKEGYSLNKNMDDVNKHWTYNLLRRFERSIDLSEKEQILLIALKNGFDLFKPIEENSLFEKILSEHRTCDVDLIEKIKIMHEKNQLHENIILDNGSLKIRRI